MYGGGSEIPANILFGHVGSDEDFAGPPIPTGTAPANGVATDAASYGGVPKRQEVLLPEQAALIRESYARIEKDRKQHALIMYLTIFDICPEAKPLFSMVRESTEPSPVNPRLKAHATLAFTMVGGNGRVGKEGRGGGGWEWDGGAKVGVNPRLKAHATLAFTMVGGADGMIGRMGWWVGGTGNVGSGCVNGAQGSWMTQHTGQHRSLSRWAANTSLNHDGIKFKLRGFYFKFNPSPSSNLPPTIQIFRTGFMKALQRAFGEEWFGDLEAAWCAAFDILEDMASSGMAEKGGQKVIPPAALEMLERMQQQ
ncbi:unnamed protein product [Closterium sp. NIES-54]